MRTGDLHGFRQQSSAKRIRVFRLDQGTSPATIVYDDYHPIDKQPYDVDATTLSADSLNRMASFRGTCNQHGIIHFDTNGTPWCVGPVTTLVSRYEVELVSGIHRRTVELDPITGRVTIQ